jgi:predicted Zn finger-like uncharacterized protein
MDKPYPTPPASETASPPPERCPACKSSSIVTTAKNPGADSYWRCTACGEMWNVSRSQKDRYGRPRWR